MIQLSAAIIAASVAVIVAFLVCAGHLTFAEVVTLVMTCLDRDWMKTL